MATAKSFRHPGIEVLAFGLRFAEPCMLLVTGLIAYMLRQGFVGVPATYGVVIFSMLIIYGILGELLMIYQTHQMSQLLMGLPRAAGALLSTFGGMVLLLFMMKISNDFSRIWMMVWLVLAMMCLVGLRIWASITLRRRMKQGLWLRRLAVLGTGPKAMELLRRLNNSVVSGVKLVGFYSLDEGNVSADLKRTPLYRGTLETLLNDSKQDIFDDIVITEDLDTMPLVDRVLNMLHMLSVNVYYCLPLPLFGLTGGSTSILTLGNAPLVLMFRQPLEGYSLFMKRWLDILVSALVLILASPFMLVIAVLVKLSSAGPVFFRQKRHGFNSGEFEMLKFRSMRVGEVVTDEDGKEKQAQVGDARITWVGRILRATSLDELPQLINVLKGDMSLVGPRPHALSHNNYYERLIERYASRHKMPPGLTGWAQLNGWRGETETIEKMAKRVEYDIWYIENWSFALDLKILLLTPLVLLFQRRAY